MRLHDGHEQSNIGTSSITSSITSHVDYASWIFSGEDEGMILCSDGFIGTKVSIRHGHDYNSSGTSRLSTPIPEARFFSSNKYTLFLHDAGSVNPGFPTCRS